MDVAVAQGRRLLGLQGQGQPVGGGRVGVFPISAISGAIRGRLAQLGGPIGHNQIKVQQAAPGVAVDAMQQEIAHGTAH
jgi:hypothetical protein